MPHEAFERFNSCVLNGIKLIAESKGHFHASIPRSVIIFLGQVSVAASFGFPHFEVADYSLAYLALIEFQHLALLPCAGLTLKSAYPF